MSRFLFVLVVVSCFPISAVASDLPAELAKCRGIDSLSQRLQCYDRLVDGMPEVNVTSTVSEPAKASQEVTSRPEAPKAEPKPAPQTTQPQVEPETLFGKSSTEVQETVAKKLEIETLDQISSLVRRIQISPSKAYVVHLENGQVWRQKSKEGSWRIKVGETAIISKGTLGSFLMRSSARKKSVRAERVR